MHEKVNLIGIAGKQKSGKDTVAKMIQYLSFYDTTDRIPFEDLFEGELRGCDWQIKKFAYKVKQIASLLTGIPVEDFEKQEVKDMELGKEWIKYCIIPGNEDSKILTVTDKKRAEQISKTYGIKFQSDKKSYVTEHKLTVREFLQRIGTECMRDNLHPNTWVNALFADYECAGKGNKNAYHWMDCTCESEEDCDYRNSHNDKWIISDVRFENECKAIKDRNGILIRINRYMGTQLIGSEEHHKSETALDSYNDWDYEIENNRSLDDLLEQVKKICKKEKII